MWKRIATGLDPDVTYALWLSPPDGTWDDRVAAGTLDDRVAAGTFRPNEYGEVDVRLRSALPVNRGPAASGPPPPKARSPSTPSNP